MNMHSKNYLFWLKLLLGLAFILILSFQSSKTVAQEKITLSIGEWPPFTSESLPHYGIGPHIITAAFAKVDIDVEYQWYPWARAIKLVEDKDVDVSGIWLHNADRAAKFFFSSPVLNSTTVFFYHKDSDFDWTDFESFSKDTVVGVTRSYSYGSVFDEAVKAGKVTTDVTRNDAQNLEKLMRQRIDAYPSDELVARSILNASFSSEQINLLRVHPTPITEAPLHVISSKNNAKGIEIVNKFSKGLELLRRSGEFDTILNQYR